MNIQVDTVPKSIDKEPDEILDLIADSLNRYPGEKIQFSIRVKSSSILPGRQLSLILPKGFEWLDSALQNPLTTTSNFAHEDQENLIISWSFQQVENLNEDLEVSTLVRVLPANHDGYLTCTAELRDAEGYLLASKSVQINIRTQSSYIKYLPEIYSSNEFLGRFLMLFESFWQPVELQIKQGEYYYDANLTPKQFLPWLASWIGVTWDDQLPDVRKRQMLSSALQIYQQRGTRNALHTILSIYTGGEVEIIEHRTQNFVLGANSSLGHTVALGKLNFPHTFTVNLKVDPEEIAGRSGMDKTQQLENYRQSIEKLIDTQKPAHTAARLNLNLSENQSGVCETSQAIRKDLQ